MIWPFKKKKKFPIEGKNDFGYIPVVSDEKNDIHCPNCGGIDWIKGPEGGVSVNLQCPQCLKYYNYMGLFGFQDIGDRSHVFGIKPKTDDAQTSNQT